MVPIFFLGFWADIPGRWYDDHYCPRDKYKTEFSIPYGSLSETESMEICAYACHVEERCHFADLYTDQEVGLICYLSGENCGDYEDTVSPFYRNWMKKHRKVFHIYVVFLVLL